MAENDTKKLEVFLAERFGFKIPPDVVFRSAARHKLDRWLRQDDTPKGKVVNLSMNDFLTDDFRFNPSIETVVSETIRREGLKIYAGIVSYDGRQEAALATGGNTFENLKQLEEKGLITRFLSYQGDRAVPSPLCRLALKEGIKVFFVDEVRVKNRQNRCLLDRRARGKTENILKGILMLEREVRTEGLDPRKVFVLFMDDDYCLLDDRAHYILVAAWVLSFARSRAKGTRRLINLCRDVGFVKNGGVRIHIPDYLAQKILRGEVIKNYRSLIVEALNLDIGINENATAAEQSERRDLIERIESLPQDCILTPENLPALLSTSDVRLVRSVLGRYFYAGGRVTKPFTRRNVHEAENILSNWLGQFTFILQGDQGTTLANWMLKKLGRGYAFDSSVIIQFLMGAEFSDQRIVDIRNTPHAHQHQEQFTVEGMEDLINLVTECLRVYYGNWHVDSFIQRYQRRTRVSWLADGRYIRAKIKTKRGILFYPPASRLELC